MWEKLLKVFNLDAARIVDEVVTSKEEKQRLNIELGQLVMEHFNGARELLARELSGNWLQRSWRPLSMLAFVFVVLYEYFFQPVLGAWLGLAPVNTSERFWGLLEIGFGGYVVGRSFEKIADTLARSGLSFRKNEKIG